MAEVPNTYALHTPSIGGSEPSSLSRRSTAGGGGRIGVRTQGGFAKFKAAFAGFKTRCQEWQASRVQAIDAKVANKNIVVRGLWSAAKLLGSAVKGILTNKVLWGMGLITLGALGGWVVAAPILIGIGLAVAAYGIFENTKDTYQVARMAGFGKLASGGFATAAFLLNVASTAAAFLTFGAAAGISAKATAALQGAINYFGAGTHALTHGVELASRHMAHATLNEVGKAVAGTGLIGLPAGTQILKDYLTGRQREEDDDDDSWTPLSSDRTVSSRDLWEQPPTNLTTHQLEQPSRHNPLLTPLRSLENNDAHDAPKSGNRPNPVVSSEPSQKNEKTEDEDSTLSRLSTASQKQDGRGDGLDGPLIPPQNEPPANQAAVRPPVKNEPQLEQEPTKIQQQPPPPAPPKKEPTPPISSNKKDSVDSNSSDDYGPKLVSNQKGWVPPSQLRKQNKPSGQSQAPSGYADVGGILVKNSPLKPLSQGKANPYGYDDYEFPKGIQKKNADFVRRQSRTLSMDLQKLAEEEEPQKLQKGEFTAFIGKAREIVRGHLKKDFSGLCDSYELSFDRLQNWEYMKVTSPEEAKQEAETLLKEICSKGSAKFRAAYLEINEYLKDHPQRDQLWKDPALAFFDDKGSYGGDAVRAWCRNWSAVSLEQMDKNLTERAENGLRRLAELKQQDQKAK